MIPGEKDLNRDKHPDGAFDTVLPIKSDSQHSYKISKCLSTFRSYECMNSFNGSFHTLTLERAPHNILSSF